MKCMGMAFRAQLAVLMELAGPESLLSCPSRGDLCVPFPVLDFGGALGPAPCLGARLRRWRQRRHRG